MLLEKAMNQQRSLSTEPRASQDRNVPQVYPGLVMMET